MGLLDTALGMLGGQSGEAGGSGSLIQAAMSMLSSDHAGGGLQGLVNAFNEAGLGEKVQSWISNNPNLPISGEQIQEVLGKFGHLGELANATGQSESETAGQLANILPEMINKLTPDGTLPEGGINNVMGMIGQFFK